MIVINGSVTDEIKQRLLAGKSCPPSRRHANLIIAGGNFADGNIWSPATNPIEQGSIVSSSGNDSGSATRLRTNGYIKVLPNTTYVFESNLARAFVLQYDEGKGAPIATNSWQTFPFKVTTSPSTHYIRMTFAHDGNAEIVVDDFEWMKIKKEEV